MCPKEYIAELFCASAEEFTDAIARRNRRWGADPTEWIFRGHADCRWQLVPSAFRKNVYLDLGPDAVAGPKHSHWEQALAELSLLKQFLNAANEQGLDLPAVAEQFWFEVEPLFHRTMKAIKGPQEEWPIPPLRPLFALAQHHGIPTRLLDWTRDPLTAAYFAAEQAAKWAKEPNSKPCDAESLEVWAFNHHTVDGFDFWSTEDERIRLVLAPGTTNPNLRAQRGLFTLVAVNNAQPHGPAVCPPLDVLILAKLEKQSKR